MKKEPEKGCLKVLFFCVLLHFKSGGRSIPDRHGSRFVRKGKPLILHRIGHAETASAHKRRRLAGEMRIHIAIGEC